MDILSYEEAVVRAKSHDRISHYTTFNALKCIIENSSLRLSRIDLLNDCVENSGIADLWKSKVYVSCFTYREYESYFFWVTYSKGEKESVMISVDTNCFENAAIHPDDKCEQHPLGICKKADPSIPFSPEIEDTSWGIFDCSTVDVSYIGRNQDIDSLKNTQGRIKYCEWDMELETRLRVAVRPRCLEFHSNNAKLEYLTPNNKYLYLKLSKAHFSSMTITLSPFASDEFCGEVMQLLDENGLKDIIKVKNSVLTGEI